MIRIILQKNSCGSHFNRYKRLYFSGFMIVIMVFSALSGSFAQSIVINGKAGGKRFDGIGAVSGGGGTSVLLKDYPNKQRDEILDLLFKPKFGASISALLVEVPGDGNSTQGSEPSHMHSRTDLNYYRGYEWWLMREAKKRNPALSLDANVWSAPRWIGNNQFWSQDMCDYVVKWIQGLKSTHGLTLDAIGLRNERGVNIDYVKMLHRTLNNNGLAQVKIHGFDNWQKDKFDWATKMIADTTLRSAVAILSAHTLSEIPAPDSIQLLAKDLHKPIWNTEEHVYLNGFDCALGIVDAFNKNYIISGATKIVNWYLCGSTYSIEPFSQQPPMLIARQPWSGHYQIREALWGYAHYGQFTAADWQYVNGGCDTLKEGGSYVTLKAPDRGDYSIIIETRGAKSTQQLNFEIKGGLSRGALAVWKSDWHAQFIRQTDILPQNGHFSITLDTGAIYSLTTTRGQQKGSFSDTLSAHSFPFPYQDNFDQYKNPKAYGYLPSYTADIAGVFEISPRTDKRGNCLKQVLAEKPQCWAPEWEPYTIIGDPNWTDYEVSVDMMIDNQGAAGVMGRVNGTGYGFGVQPNAYYLTLSDSGICSLYVVSQDEKVKPKLLASKKLPRIKPNQWHRLGLKFKTAQISGMIDGKTVLAVLDTTYKTGMAGLITMDAPDGIQRTIASFDNLKIGGPDQLLTEPTIENSKKRPSLRQVGLQSKGGKMY